MDEFSGTLVDVESRFGSERACWDYLVKLRWSAMNASKLEPEASGMRRRRMRLMPFPRSSQATATKAFVSVCRPRTPSSIPPTNTGGRRSLAASSSNVWWSRHSLSTRSRTRSWSAAASPGGIRVPRSSYWSQLNSQIAELWDADLDQRDRRGPTVD